MLGKIIHSMLSLNIKYRFGSEGFWKILLETFSESLTGYSLLISEIALFYIGIIFSQLKGLKSTMSKEKKQRI